MTRPKEIVILGMFDLTQINSARAVRIHNLHRALQALTPVRLIAGDRMSRRLAVLRYLLGGGLRRTRALYVEASTSTATEVDLWLLALAHRTGIPVLVYIPDAYQYFPDFYPRQGWRVKLLDWGWQRSIAAYLRWANIMLFPSAGLAACFQARQRVELLPPAGTPGRTYSLPAEQPSTVVYIGASSYNDGTDLLLDAMELVVTHCPAARCRLITRNEGAIADHRARRAPWLTIEQRSFEELPDLMKSATLAVIPRLINRYHDLALPIKLFDYMSFGRPLVVTACRDTADLVTQLEAGIVVEDTPESLAEGILKLLENPDLATRLGQNGYRAIQTTHAWSHRAARLLELIEGLEENNLAPLQENRG